MLAFIALFHIGIALILILLVAVQDSKEGVGLFSGGSQSDSVFGASSENILSKMTKWIAIIFSVTCISLTYMTSKKGKSILDEAPLTAPPVESQKKSSEKP